MRVSCLHLKMIVPEVVPWCILYHSTLFDIWQSMAEGPPIDEQRALRQAAAQTANTQLPADTSPVGPPPDDSDDDRDPSLGINMVSGPSDDPYADLEDDEDDY